MNHLTSLPWDDVVFPYIIQRLPLPDVFRLRRVNKECYLMVSEYFSSLTRLEVDSRNNTKLSSLPFNIIIKSRRRNTNYTNLGIIKKSLGTHLHDNYQQAHQHNKVSEEERKNEGKEGEKCDTSIFSHRRLKHLILPLAKWLSDHDLEEIIEEATYLETLDLSGCSQVRRIFNCHEEKSFFSQNKNHSWKRRWTHLTFFYQWYLFLSQISNGIFTRLISHFGQRLTVLNLKDCHWMSNQSVILIGMLFSVM